MAVIKWNRAFVLLPILSLASVAPSAFLAALLGVAPLSDLALYAIVPAFFALLAVAVWSLWTGRSAAGRIILSGATAGATATLALEAVRYPGFRMGFMPGNLPELMGVLLLDQFAAGPSPASTIAGFTYHAWNGASFGIIFAALVYIGLSRPSTVWSVAYGLIIGMGFLASPVVQSLGGGPFGLDFGWRFIVTVLTAHAAFGFALSRLLQGVEACASRLSGCSLSPGDRVGAATGTSH
jgi:hypothetical protein